MASTPEKLALAREFARLSPDVGKRGKGKKTIAKEERRRIFDEMVSQEFPKLIKKARPEYKLDQFMGKTPEVIEIAPELKGLIEKANKILPA